MNMVKRVGETALLICAAIALPCIVLGLARVDQSRLISAEQAAQLSAQLTQCTQQLNQERLARQKADAAIDHADYFLWEVHTLVGLPRQDPRSRQYDEGLLPALCEKLGDHSVLRLGATLNAYSLWSDVTGQQKLGCRYVKKKEGSP